MLKWKLPVIIASAGIIGFVAGQALPVSGNASAAQPEKKAAQPDKKPDKGMPNMDDMMKMFSQPGEQHKTLESMLGHWEGGVKMWMDPAAPPMESKGSVDREWAMDGMFVIERVDATNMMGGDKRFKGMGIVGYNLIEKKYESVWIENMSSAISTATGTYDAAKKIFTFEGDMLDPASGKRVKQKSTLDVSNPNRHVMAGYGAGPDGKEFKNFEGVFEKKGK